MGGRHAVVVGSQCAGLPGQPLSFLPGRVEALFAVLTDPARGGCDPAASVLVVDPTLAELALAVKQGVRGAAAAGATLVLVFVGHAETLGDGGGGADLYLMPVDGVVPPDSDTGYLLGQRLRELLAGLDAVGLDGLLLVVDACHAGVGAMNVAQRAATMVASSGVRLEMLTATFDRAARDGCFSRTLTDLLSRGLEEVSNDYLDAVAVVDRVAGACITQEEPLRFSLARGRRITGDPGLWLARNPEASGRWPLSGTAAGGHAVALTQSYQVTDVIERVQGSMLTSRVTVVTGGAGSGKSALVAALARPEVAPDLVPAGGFLNAVAFTALAPTAAEIAQELAAQLARTGGFVDATRRYQNGFQAEELDRQPALQRLVLGPLRELALAPGRRLRVAIDGIDQLHPQVRHDVLKAIRDLAVGGSREDVRVLLTSRPGVAELDGFAAVQPIELDRPSPQEVAEYAQQVGVPVGLVTALAEHVHSWLDLQLWAQVAAIGDEPDVDPTGLDVLYAARLAEGIAKTGPGAGAVLAVLGAAGAGAVLPVTVAAAAVTCLGVPMDVPALRDVLAGLGAIVVRADPGTSAEHVGLFHETLARYLEENPCHL